MRCAERGRCQGESHAQCCAERTSEHDHSMQPRGVRCRLVSVPNDPPHERDRRIHRAAGQEVGEHGDGHEDDTPAPPRAIGGEHDERDEDGKEREHHRGVLDREARDQQRMSKDWRVVPLMRDVLCGDQEPNTDCSEHDHPHGATTRERGRRCGHRRVSTYAPGRTISPRKTTVNGMPARIVIVGRTSKLRRITSVLTSPSVCPNAAAAV